MTTPSLSMTAVQSPDEDLKRFIPILAALWLFPTVAAVADFVTETSVALTLAAALATALLTMARPAAVCIGLPFVALLSPIAGLVDFGFGTLVVSDVLFALFGLQAIKVLLKSAVRGKRLNVLRFPAISLLMALSTLVAFASSDLISLKPLLYVAQLAIVGVLSARYITSSAAWRSTRTAWIIATVFSALILISAFLDGRTLDNLRDPDANFAATEDLFDIFRARYYYTGFYYVLGICIVWLVGDYGFTRRLMMRSLVAGTLLVLLAALLATVNKTAMTATVLATVAVLVLGASGSRKGGLGAGLIAMLRLAALLAGIVYLLVSYVPSGQLDLLFGRLSSDSSFITRLEVYRQALSLWIESPRGVIFGFGPDFFDSSGNPARKDLLVQSSVTGLREGTLDSAWLSYLIELGIPNFLIILSLYLDGFRKSLPGRLGGIVSEDAQHTQISILGPLIFLGVAMCTQMLGYSKISWLAVQILVVSHSKLLRHTRGSS